MLKVALLQMLAVQNSIEENIEIATSFCRAAAEQGADIAVFPETFSTGYWVPEGDRFAPWRSIAFGTASPDETIMAELSRHAIGDDHYFIQHFRHLAKELSMAIVITYLSKGKEKPRNTALLVDRYGKDIIKYSKIHLFEPFLVDAICEPGERFYVEDLDTSAGKVRLGLMICADRDYPESGRILMKYGAEVALIPNACPLKGFNGKVTDMVRVRSVENAMAMAICNYPKPKADGHSTAFDPDGKMHRRAGYNEEVNVINFDLEKIREFRSQTYAGDAFRKERFYDPLLEPMLPECFSGRKNAAGIVRR